MIVLGIDPGKSGGLVCIRDGAVAGIAPAASSLADLWALIRWVLVSVDEQHGETIQRAYLEKVASSPQMGVKSAFTFGQGYGHLEMALTAAGVSFERVTPSVWQRSLGCLTKGDKNITKRKAQELFPGHKWTHKTADAALIAYYGWRREIGKEGNA